jgi:hypothetical protein
MNDGRKQASERGPSTGVISPTETAHTMCCSALSASLRETIRGKSMVINRSRGNNRSRKNISSFTLPRFASSSPLRSNASRSPSSSEAANRVSLFFEPGGLPPLPGANGRPRVPRPSGELITAPRRPANTVNGVQGCNTADVGCPDDRKTG